ncbi:PseT [Roseibium sp. TrichSKD4]|uniref:phosphatase domain-containing protein n=1 Tax=Roseibium sp. TrichSKD4 TaxID=744980 RepID=UPI0001E56247|nr:hypothetical protein [Roseibium sp. TrichSKD4]EFO33806.1 PseT [Roseibium sp. TrichSKD4]
MYVIFDLDGTLCDISHRLFWITGDTKNWDAFYNCCVDDTPKWEILHVMDGLVSGGHRVEIWTGRSERVREESVDWLDRHGGFGKYLRFMRAVDDRRPDVDLKRHMLMTERARGNFPTLVFEDRQRVVDMWRAEGLTCCQVAAWEEH